MRKKKKSLGAASLYPKLHNQRITGVLLFLPWPVCFSVILCRVQKKSSRYYGPGSMGKEISLYTLSICLWGMLSANVQTVFNVRKSIGMFFSVCFKSYISIGGPTMACTV